MSSLSRVPVDVFASILDVACSPSTRFGRDFPYLPQREEAGWEQRRQLLYSCSLVSRAWNSVAQPKLYEEVWMLSERAAKLWLDRPVNAGLETRKLVFTVKIDASMELLEGAVKATVGLQELIVFGYVYNVLRHILQRIDLPNLKKLALDGVSLVPRWPSTVDIKAEDGHPLDRFLGFLRLRSPLPPPQPFILPLTHLWINLLDDRYRAFAICELLAATLPTLQHLALFGRAGRQSSALGRVLEDAKDLSSLRSISVDSNCFSFSLRFALRKAQHIEAVYLKGKVSELVEIIEDCTSASSGTEVDRGLTANFFPVSPCDYGELQSWLKWMGLRGVRKLVLHWYIDYCEGGTAASTWRLTPHMLYGRLDTFKAQCYQAGIELEIVHVRSQHTDYYRDHYKVRTVK